MAANVRWTTMRLSARDLAVMLAGVEAMCQSDRSRGGLTAQGRDTARRVFTQADRMGISYPGYAWMRAACGMNEVPRNG